MRFTPGRLAAGKAVLPRALALVGASIVAAIAFGVLPSANSTRATAEDAAPPGAPEPAAEESLIRSSADAFLGAFNRNDAKALAALWTPAGTMSDENGEIFKGRDAIRTEYENFFRANPGAKINVRIKSIHFPTPTVAEEDGVAQVSLPGGSAPVASRYTAIHVRHEGAWLMASVRESRIEFSSNFVRLKELDWFIGDWKTVRDETTVRMSFRWVANRSFVQQNFSVSDNGIVTSSGVQMIGFDPEAGQIRSWSFDSNGGFGTGLWSPTNDGYRIISRGVLPDGTPTTSNDFLIRTADEDSVLGWRSTDRTAGGAEIPDTGEMVLDRVSAKP